MSVASYFKPAKKCAVFGECFTIFHSEPNRIFQVDPLRFDPHKALAEGGTGLLDTVTAYPKVWPPKHFFLLTLSSSKY